MGRMFVGGKDRTLWIEFTNAMGQALYEINVRVAHLR